MEAYMKNYRITVNGNVYDVTVEETGATASAPAAPVASAAPKALQLKHLQLQVHREQQR